MFRRGVSPDPWPTQWGTRSTRVGFTPGPEQWGLLADKAFIFTLLPVWFAMSLFVMSCVLFILTESVTSTEWCQYNDCYTKRANSELSVQDSGQWWSTVWDVWPCIEPMICQQFMFCWEQNSVGTPDWRLQKKITFSLLLTWKTHAGSLSFF